MRTRISDLWEVPILLAVVLATWGVGHLGQEGGGQQEEETGVLHPQCGGEWGGVGRDMRGRYL